jgi:hypothetical protein
VAYTCNPTCSGSRDQEDPGSKPPQANSSRDPILKIPNTKKELVEWLKVWTLSSNPSTTRKKSFNFIKTGVMCMEITNHSGS